MKRKLLVCLLCVVLVVSAVISSGCVQNNVEAINITSANNKTEVEVGETLLLTATVTPTQSSQEVNWQSADTSKATVDSNGLVTAIAAGNVTITATSVADEKISATFALVIKDKDSSTDSTTPTSVALSTANNIIAVNEGGTLQITATVSPATASQEVVWTTSDDKIATVTNGLVTGVKEGTVTVTAAAKNADSVKSSITITVAKEITIAEAISLCTETESAQRYYIRAIVKTIDNATYGSMTIKDETGEISVYGTRGADGTTFYDKLDDKPYAGDEVLLYATLQLFKDTPEVKIGWIMEVKHNQVEIDESKYVQMNIANARNAAKDSLIKTSGVVSRITFANGKIPSGFILIDDTSSIYVYDPQIAVRVAIGNFVTILGTKDYYILADEMSSAEKFGYKGCNQLTKVILKENDNNTNAFDKTWITETTVKDILETPISQDITSLTYKVNALVKKQQGTGFVNYYFNDIDGVTGSYTYTQCNGGDFAWLDEFDGKICTVYLTAINAKSNNAGCVWRFIPIEVKDEGYEFDVNEAAEYAIKYVAADQFKTSYSIAEETTLPNELITSVSSELLKFENVSVTYTSSNNDVLAITIDNGKPYLTLKGAGKATVTISATHGQNSASKNIEIIVNTTLEIESVTVAEAIAAEVGTNVTVKGIVGPSLVNQVGFYLIDNSGVIAVITTSETISQLQLGNEVVLQGTRAIRKNDKELARYGQTNLDNCTILSNDYGKHDYSTETFVENKTLPELQAIPATEDATTTVYVIKASVKVVEGPYSSNIYLTADGAEKDFTLYCSSAKQYNWLKEFDGQEVTLEVALCNWNNKTYYVGCVLAVRNEDGTKICNELNFSK